MSRMERGGREGWMEGGEREREQGDKMKDYSVKNNEVRKG